jgi:hypothetical protein
VTATVRVLLLVVVMTHPEPNAGEKHSIRPAFFVIVSLSKTYT